MFSSDSFPGYSSNCVYLDFTNSNITFLITTFAIGITFSYLCEYSLYQLKNEMQSLFLTYLILGLIFCLIGPLSRRVKESISKHTLPSPSDIFLGKPPVPLGKKLLIIVALFTVSIAFYPFFYVVIVIDYFRKKSFNKNIQHEHPQDNLLYFKYIPGAGKLTCNSCNFQSEIVGFLHSEDESGLKTTGYQCQNCGKFQSITDNIVNPISKLCSCGGNLDRNNPIFCPNCKSENISYKIEIIT